MIRLLLFLLAAALPARAQIERIPAPDAASGGGGFGAAVALSGGRLLVGAGGEAACGENAGAAYVYRLGDGRRYHLEARLAPEACGPDRFFGRAVALDGDRALVAGVQPFLGAPEANPVLLYERRDGRWQEAARLFPPDASGVLGFGAAVALDGDRALVTAEGDAGAGRPGSAYVYEHRYDGTWHLAARLTAPGRFGAFAVLDGDRLAVTAPPEREGEAGAVYVYERDAGGRWRQAARLDGFTDLDTRCALSGDGLLVGHSRGGTGREGLAVVYRRDAGGAWLPEATLRPQTTYDLGAFGVAVALDGERALVAGYTEQIHLPFNIDRVVYVFAREGEAWVERQVVDVGSTAFGIALDVEGRRAVVGEAGDGAPGAAYVAELF